MTAVVVLLLSVRPAATATPAPALPLLEIVPDAPVADPVTWIVPELVTFNAPPLALKIAAEPLPPVSWISPALFRFTGLPAIAKPNDWLLVIVPVAVLVTIAVPVLAAMVALVELVSVPELVTVADPPSAALLPLVIDAP